MLYFSARLTRSDILCFFFSRVERALVLLCCILCVWNALWHYCVIFYACGTRSVVIVLYSPRMERALALLCYTFLHVERALALLCYIFRVWNALWRYCVIFSAFGGPARGMRSGVIVLYFLRVECALVLCVKFISSCNILTLFFARVYFKTVLV